MTRLRALPVTPAEQRVDLAIAAAITVGALISTALSSVAGLYGNAQSADITLAVGYAFALGIPLAVRRRWPATVAVIVCLAYFTAVTLRIPELWAGNIAVFIAFYTVGAFAPDRRRAHAVRIVIVIGMFVWLGVTTLQDVTEPAADGVSRAGAFSPYLATMIISVLINVLYFAGAYYFGERTWAATQQRRELEQRTAELEREREITAAQAVALDRVRIARELHDIVAHHVSLMGVQAGAARAVMTKDPDAARATLTQVETSARTALSELRQLLQTLRTPGDDETAAAAPTTLTLDALPALAEGATRAGLPARFSIIGTARPVPPLVQANLARIAQEALTNARRHAGPDAEADIRLRYLADTVELEVWNRGRSVRRSTPGLGQLGMQERTNAVAGILEIGPRTGGYLVRVRVPLSETLPGDEDA